MNTDRKHVTIENDNPNIYNEEEYQKWLEENREELR